MNINLKKGLNQEYRSFMNFSPKIKNLISNIYKPVVDTIFPPVCFLCDSFLEDDRKVVCTKCWSNLKVLSPTETTKIEKILIKNKFENIHILYDFTEDFQKIIHLLKYERCISLAYYFSCEMIKYFKDHILPNMTLLHLCHYTLPNTVKEDTIKVMK